MFVTRHTHVRRHRGLPTSCGTCTNWRTEAWPKTPVTREMFYRHEFDDAIADPSNRLWVLWDDDEPVAMALIATDIGSTRYLSRAYFEHHYPDHMRRGAVHYILWSWSSTLAHAAKGALVRLAREGSALEAAEGALLVFDSPEMNQPRDRPVALRRDDGAAGQHGRQRRGPASPARGAALLRASTSPRVGVRRGTARPSRARSRTSGGAYLIGDSRSCRGTPCRFATVWANESHSRAHPPT